MKEEIRKILDMKYNVTHRIALADKSEQEKLGRKVDFLEAHAFMAKMNVPLEWMDIPAEAELRLEDRSWKQQGLFILYPNYDFRN